MISASDPFELFTQWFNQAKKALDISEPTAMTLATSTRDGSPSARIVLLKSFDVRGFCFFTNYESRKSKELQANPNASLCFYWMPLDKQVRIIGRAEKTSESESDAYFASRERARQIGAWTSRQSETLNSREQFDLELKATEARFDGKDIPRPPHWGGWRIIPQEIEFWIQAPHRWHERVLFVKSPSGWEKRLLYP
ncbi:MAG: pyridoxamine 5'-phosphate oxidase [Rickettsiales bacterium]